MKRCLITLFFWINIVEMVQIGDDAIIILFVDEEIEQVDDNFVHDILCNL